MLPNSTQQVGSPEVKLTQEKVIETVELLGRNFSNFDKHKAHRNSTDGSKVSTTSVQKV